MISSSTVWYSIIIPAVACYNEKHTSIRTKKKIYYFIFNGLCEAKATASSHSQRVVLLFLFMIQVNNSRKQREACSLLVCFHGCPSVCPLMLNSHLVEVNKYRNKQMRHELYSKKREGQVPPTPQFPSVGVSKTFCDFHPLFVRTPTGKPCYTCFISIYWHWWSQRASPETDSVKSQKLRKVLRAVSVPLGVHSLHLLVCFCLFSHIWAKRDEAAYLFFFFSLFRFSKCQWLKPYREINVPVSSHDR